MACFNNKDFKSLKEDVLNVVLNIKNMSIPEMTACVRKAEDYKDLLLDYYFELMTLWYRDILIFESTRDANGVVYKDYITQISKQSQVITFEGLENITEAIRKAEKVAELLKKENRDDIIIEVDGNITPEHASTLHKIGANIFVCGTSSIFKGDVDKYRQNIKTIRKVIND